MVGASSDAIIFRIERERVSNWTSKVDLGRIVIPAASSTAIQICAQVLQARIHHECDHVRIRA